MITLRAGEAAVQCIVIATVCLCVCLWVCSDHRQIIKFWPPCAPREGGLRRCAKFRLRLTTASVQCLRRLRVFFHLTRRQFFSGDLVGALLHFRAHYRDKITSGTSSGGGVKYTGWENIAIITLITETRLVHGFFGSLTGSHR